MPMRTVLFAGMALGLLSCAHQHRTPASGYAGRIAGEHAAEPFTFHAGGREEVLEEHSLAIMHAVLWLLPQTPAFSTTQRTIFREPSSCLPPFFASLDGMRYRVALMVDGNEVAVQDPPPSPDDLDLLVSEWPMACLHFLDRDRMAKAEAIEMQLRHDGDVIFRIEVYK